jgi:hypothetical protein
MQTTKICTKCKKELPAISEYFYDINKSKPEKGLTADAKSVLEKMLMIT